MTDITDFLFHPLFLIPISGAIHLALLASWSRQENRKLDDEMFFFPLVFILFAHFVCVMVIITSVPEDFVDRSILISRFLVGLMVAHAILHITSHSFRKSK